METSIERGDVVVGHETAAGSGHRKERRAALIRQINWFVCLVFALSTVPYILLLAADEATLRRDYVILLMWTPALAAVIALRLSGLSIATLGWKWGEWRWNRRGYLLPLGYTSIAYLLIWIGGAGVFLGEAQLAAIAGKLDWQTANPVLLVAGFIAIKASAGIIIGLSSALGEELGWRGFLAPRLAELGGFMPAALITGAIWAVWHFPLLLFGGYNNGTEWWFGLACFGLLVFNASIILTWLRMRSGSVWPCAIFHASHNLFIQAVFTPLTGESGDSTPYAIGEFGIAVPAVMTLFAVIIWREARGSTRVRTEVGP